MNRSVLTGVVPLTIAAAPVAPLKVLAAEPVVVPAAAAAPAQSD